MNRRKLLIAGSCAFCLAVRRALALGGRRMHVDQVTGEMVPDNPPEVYEWMEKAVSQGAVHPDGSIDYTHNSIHCCGKADAKRLTIDEWRRADEYEARNDIMYEVKIHDIWYPIHPWQLIKDPLEHPNPTGQAVVWVGEGSLMGIQVYCFSPWEAML